MATRHNLCPNPAVGVDVTGWAGGETPVRTDVTGQGFPRSWAARYSTATYSFGPVGAATPGLSYTVSAWVRPTNFTVGGTLAILWADAGANEIGESTTPFPAAPTGAATRVSVSGTAPASTVSLRLLHFGEDYAGNPCLFTGLLYEQAAALGSYFDGSSLGASWDGTPDLSPSTLVDAAAAAPPPRSYARARRALLVR